jgi:diguanylate cyclase (GGDEF)-like protein
MPALSKSLSELAARVAELEAEREMTLRLAQTDSLTGLVNRGAFTGSLCERLEAAREAGTSVALFIIDLDRFKNLNDTLGHHAGDLLLVRARPAACATRPAPAKWPPGLGGDEFALVTETPIPPRAPRLVSILAQRRTIYGRTVSPSGSVGVRFPRTRPTPATCSASRPGAYRAQGQGRARLALLREALREEGVRRHPSRTSCAAPAAGENRAVVPADHRVHDRPHGRRPECWPDWNHPEKGLPRAGAFVPMAEELGLIRVIDEAVFEAACARTAPWVADGLIETVACNVSPRDLLDPAFSRKLINRLAKTALPATAMQVEITETFLLQDMALARRHIERLAAKGVSVALDDFGTGYSNLRALMHLPIQTVKLDRSLIDEVGRDPRVSKLVASMLHAARSLGLRIVAEGVEDEGQALFLRAAGCDRMQGYFFARPMDGDAMEARLREAAAPAAQLAEAS